MKNRNPIVSIITPVYNSSRFISATLDSVLTQTHEDWEMIVVDDASTDNSIEIINTYIQKDKRFRLFQLTHNQGQGVARNKAIKEARGRIIAFLDSDDIWKKEKLERHVAFMLKHNAAFSHTSYGYLDEEGNVIKSTYYVSKKPVTYNDLLKRTEISCLTAMYDTKYIGKMYMPDLRRKQDYALWLDILKTGVNSIPLDEELAYYRQVKGSVTSKKWNLIKEHWEFLYQREKLNIFQSCYYLLQWGLEGVAKYYLK